MKTIKVTELLTSRFPHMNTNGSFILTKNGILIFIYCRSMKPNNCVLCRTISTDGGFSWSKPSIIHTNHKEKSILSSPSMLYLNNGTILIVYVVFIAPFSYIYCMSSTDDGMTWSTPTRCTGDSGYYIISNDHAFLSSSGRIILPLSFHDINVNRTVADIDLSNIDQILNPHGTSVFLISDDNGRTWNQNSNTINLNESSSSSGIQEPGLIEKSNGVLYGWARTDLGRQYEFYSFDNGITWTQPEPSVFSSSCSTAIIKRRNHDGLFVAIWNPIPNYISHDFDNINCRQELVYAVSHDEGQSWSEPIVIENEPFCEYSHPALYFIDNYMVVAYNVTSGKQSRSFQLRIRIIYFN